ncbi:mitochondrial genome maintenance exonuclease 1 [Limosa lapponica baueri]|uniref:Mitochondrial genome maintenance exonuclease 1 n=1 Tax=Limosa lapponica baueri TaxID=1758121 RepID=A0A2I0TKR8_LIMLA|nr:mitochondrial genome maintenance exonuclease 1 [Limosa lapponica baueri]
MKFLQLLSRKPGKLGMLFQIPFCQNQSPYLCLATSTCLYSKKKKTNSYEQVDQEKYKNLVYSVTSYKTSAQTPETILEEDNLLYGPPGKHRPPVKAETKTPKNCIPLINPNKRIPLLSSESNLPMKIPLQKTKMPSVTRILQQTMSPQQAFYLERWKQKMIQELGKDGFAEYTKRARVYYERTSVNLSSDLCSRTTKMDSETCGKGRLCVIDWKTSEKPKPFLKNTFDNPLQVAAYIGAINHDANYDFQVSCGLIVVAYKNGSPAHPHFMDPDLCSRYWNKWLLRLEEYMDKTDPN